MVCIKLVQALTKQFSLQLDEKMNMLDCCFLLASKNKLSQIKIKYNKRK
jgi:hypothetical protein